MSAVYTIVTNANIRTKDAAHPSVEALAIKGGRIVALGDSHSIRDLANGGTRTLDEAIAIRLMPCPAPPACRRSWSTPANARFSTTTANGLSRRPGRPALMLASGPCRA
jgi:hypothetical protein